MFKDLVLKSRSYRRFDESYEIDTKTLVDLVALARTAPTTVNSQALKFKIINNREENEKVFKTLHFAGLLKGKGTPVPGERPSAYIIILTDLSIGNDKRFDDGIAAQTILLGATEMGLGGCMLGSVDRDILYDEIGIDKNLYSIDLVIALGKPIENVIITDVDESGSTAYYRDDDGNHYVPKRKLEDLII